MKIVATVDVGDVVNGIKAMEKRGHSLGPAFERLKKPLRDDQQNHARGQEGPESKWPARKSTRVGKTKRGKRKKVRKLLGRLPKAVKYAVSVDSVAAISRVDWSAIHQEGGTAGRGARIPARPFLWLSNELLRVADETIAEHIAGAW